MKLDENISRIIANHILGTITPVENKVLQEWLSDSYNELVFKKITNEKTIASELTHLDAVDSHKAFKAFRSEVSKGGNWQRIMAYAAAILLPVAVGLSVVFLSDIKIENQEVVAEISPGAPSALLIMADGKVINLDDSKKNILREGSVSIENNKGVLVYDDKVKKEGLSPVVNTLKIPRGGEYQLVLSDGTKVWLNSDTKLKYTVPFTGKKRRVELSGEAYFEVARDTSKAFVVSLANGSDVEVLGTSFNIMSYEDEDELQTTLVEGKVEFSYKDSKVLLSPGKQVVFNRKSESIDVKEVDIYQYTAWKNSQFVFYDQSLDEIMKSLSRWYDFDVNYEDQNLRSLSFTIDVHRYNKIDVILNALESVEDIEFVKTKNLIYVKKK